MKMKLDNYIIEFLLVIMMINLISGWQHDYKYLLADKDRCLREQPDVVIWVQGRVTNPARRSIIREILARSSAWPPHIKPLFFFMVGRARNASIQFHLEYEYEHYRDIVQNDYKDHYKNQTAKMISSINFLADYCAQAKIAIRIDDDVVFHPRNMISQVIELINRHHGKSHYSSPDDYNHLVNYKPLLEAKRKGSSQIAIERQPLDKTFPRKTRGILLNKGNTIVCRLITNATIIRGNYYRRYYVSDEVLPSETVYPDFCAGFFFAVTMDLLPQFQSLFKVVPPFWIDDSYLGVLQKVMGISVVNAETLIRFYPPKYQKIHHLIAVHLGIRTHRKWPCRK